MDGEQLEDIMGSARVEADRTSTIQRQAEAPAGLDAFDAIAGQYRQMGSSV
jgi:hypothetical protein